MTAKGIKENEKGLYGEYCVKGKHICKRLRANGAFYISKILIFSGITYQKINSFSVGTDTILVPVGEILGGRKPECGNIQNTGSLRSAGNLSVR